MPEEDHLAYGIAWPDSDAVVIAHILQFERQD